MRIVGEARLLVLLILRGERNLEPLAGKLTTRE